MLELRSHFSVTPTPNATAQTPPVRRIIVAITGASGAIYGVRLLQVLEGLRETAGVESHLLMSPAGLMNVQHELHMAREEVEALAHVVHNVRDIGATIASGSFAAEAMVVAPCSMKTLAAVAHGLSDNLIARAADVTLKERRRLILMVRETPLNLAHLRNMTAVTEMGGIVFPPVPGFYQRPKTIDDLVDHTVGRVLDLIGLPQTLAPGWRGLRSTD
nr:UbiX family flavin prenyltransferase [Ralstonia pickettii]